MLRKRPVVLIVRDGWGHNPDSSASAANALVLAKTPVNDALLARFPVTQIRTSGEAVGLPDGVMGNSEVGHQNLGAGRVVYQEIMRISRAISDGSFFENRTILDALAHVRTTRGAFHLLGLLSDAGVHSHTDHLYALIDAYANSGLPLGNLFVHVITDGRDTPPTSGARYAAELERKLADSRAGRVSSVIGRYYAMDRDYRWDRVEQAYNLLTRGSSNTHSSAVQAIEEYYRHPSEENRQGDEFVTPASIAPGGTIASVQLVKAGDSLVFFNFRGDRPRELVKALTLPDDKWRGIKNGGFARGSLIRDLFLATMTRYEKDMMQPVLFDKPPKMREILGDYLGARGFTQLRAAESEKHPHVTYFFNDYREEPFPGEDRIEVPSPREVTTYDKKPEMAAPQVADAVVRAVESGKYDFILVNFANCDMVGHTGVLEAAVRAAEIVDRCVGRVIEAARKQGGACIVTADHGNCEQMKEPRTERPHTAHTTYDVDLIVVDDDLLGATLRPNGTLADVAPTVLELMGLRVPAEMTGRSLIDARKVLSLS